MSDTRLLFKAVNTEDEARDQAIEWQHWLSDQSPSMSDMIEYQAHFEALVERFPGLKDEFVENGII